MRRLGQLRAVCSQFAAEASKWTEVIIGEMHLPAQKRSIKPVTGQVGGVAGGEKYVHRNIFYKFSSDEHGIYGSEENAMKVDRAIRFLSEHLLVVIIKKSYTIVFIFYYRCCFILCRCGKVSSAELRALMAVLDCRVAGVLVPLTALIHHRGLCMTAQTLLPLSESSLCMGSANGGKTVYRGHPTALEKMRLVGRMLNLQEHRVWDKQRRFYASLVGPGDMEVIVRVVVLPLHTKYFPAVHRKQCSQRSGW